MTQSATFTGMDIPPLTIPGVAGPLEIQTSPWAGYKYFVNGERIKTSLLGKMTLPGASGPVEARIRATFVSPYPTILVGDAKYPAGPQPPTWLIVIALLPLVFVIGGGFLPVLIAFGAAFTNRTILRTDLSAGAKAGLVIGVFAIAAIAFCAVAVAVFGLLGVPS